MPNDMGVKYSRAHSADKVNSWSAWKVIRMACSPFAVNCISNGQWAQRSTSPRNRESQRRRKRAGARAGSTRPDNAIKLWRKLRLKYTPPNRPVCNYRTRCSLRQMHPSHVCQRSCSHMHAVFYFAPVR